MTSCNKEFITAKDEIDDDPEIKKVKLEDHDEIDEQDELDKY